MKEFKQEKVTERFAKLPEATKAIIMSDDFRDAFQSAIEKAKLTEDKETELNQQATLVLVGFATKQDFIEYVQNELGVEDGFAQVLLKGFEEDVFTPIRKSLLGEFEKKGGEKKENGGKKSAGVGDPYKEPIQ